MYLINYCYRCTLKFKNNVFTNGNGTADIQCIPMRIDDVLFR